MLDSRRRAYLAAMGIDLWRARVRVASGDRPQLVQVRPQAASQAEPERAKADQNAGLDGAASRVEQTDTPAAELDWPDLADRVAQCRDCGLCESRTQTVFGAGNTQADLLLVGEGPGEDEDQRGEPFVGQAGQLLTAMLSAIGQRRHQVYIANLLKCRLPGNRDPQPNELAACRQHLNRQVALLQPKLIVLLGDVPAKHLLNVDEPLGRLREKRQAYPGTSIPLMVTYHPAELLRDPHEKAKAWLDLQKIQRALEGEVQ